MLLYDLVFFKEEEVQATQQDRAPRATDSAKVPEGSIQEITGAWSGHDPVCIQTFSSSGSLTFVTHDSFSKLSRYSSPVSVVRMYCCHLFGLRLYR